MSCTVKLIDRSVTLIVQGLPIENERGERKYGRLRLATGLMVDPEHWSKEKQRPTVEFSVKDAFRIETEINSMAGRMSIAYQRAKDEGQLTPDRVREHFEDLVGKRKPIAAKVVSDMRLLDMLEEIERKAESSLTVAAYTTFSKKIQAFDANVKMSGLTDAWRERFFAWIKRTYEPAESTMWGQAKMLNRAINEAKRRKMKIDIDASSPFRCSQKQTDYLDWNDLKRIADHRASTPELTQIQTYVLMASLTSIRIGDWQSFFANLGMRNGIYCSVFRVSKSCGGHHPTVAPIVLRPLAEQLRKHGIPRPITYPVLRRRMDQLFTEVGIKKTTRIGPHDLRRSFISNFLSCGVFAESLLAKVFTGHSLTAGDRGVFHGYDMGDLTSKQKTFLRILGTLPKQDTGGLKLI